MNIFQHKNIIKPPLLPVFISWVIQFDKFFHPVVLYENYLICIFMNIKEKFWLWLFVGPTGVYLLDFFCSGIQFNLLLSPYPCFISLLNLDLYVLGDDALIS